VCSRPATFHTPVSTSSAARPQPHIIEPKKASVLAFAGGDGGMVFARRVNHPGSKMPERSFMRSSLRDMSTEISLGMKDSRGPLDTEIGER
jgi:hypothetical protein